MNAYRTVLLLGLGLGMAAGCSNSCEELTEKLCDQADLDLTDCSAIPENSADSSKKEAACKRMRTVVASCSGLKEKAKAANDEDLRACKADLELVRALERSQM